MKLEKLIKIINKFKEYRQLSLEIETIQQDYEKVKNKYLEIKTKISSLNQQIIQEQEIYDELDNKYHTALDVFINEEEFLNLKTQINLNQHRKRNKII